MDITASFWKVARVPSCRYGYKFKSPKFRPRLKSKRRYKMSKPKWFR